jgi:hypothetical protein
MSHNNNEAMVVNSLCFTGGYSLNATFRGYLQWWLWLWECNCEYWASKNLGNQQLKEDNNLRKLRFCLRAIGFWHVLHKLSSLVYGRLSDEKERGKKKPWCRLPHCRYRRCQCELPKSVSNFLYSWYLTGTYTWYIDVTWCNITCYGCYTFRKRVLTTPQVGVNIINIILASTSSRILIITRATNDMNWCSLIKFFKYDQWILIW